MQTTGTNWALIGLAVTALLLLGGIYALIIRAAAERKMMDAYTFVFVIVGVLGTMTVASLLIGLENTVYVVICFCASGLFPSIENIDRHNRNQRADIEGIRSKAKGKLRDGK